MASRRPGPALAALASRPCFRGPGYHDARDRERIMAPPGFASARPARPTHAPQTPSTPQPPAAPRSPATQRHRCSIAAALTQCRELKELIVPNSRALLLVTVVPAGGSAAGGPRGRRPAAVQDPVPPSCATRAQLCPVMPEPYIETILAPVMIMASLGLYVAVSGHDHETARSEGPSSSSCHCALTTPMFHRCVSSGVSPRTSPGTPAPPASLVPSDPPPATRPTTSSPQRRAPDDVAPTTTPLPPPAGSRYQQPPSTTPAPMFHRCCPAPCPGHLDRPLTRPPRPR